MYVYIYIYIHITPTPHPYEEQNAPCSCFHPEKKESLKWADAEAECQKAGGHLASVTTEEVNEALKRLTGHRFPWVGGSKESGKWRQRNITSIWLVTCNEEAERA